MGQKVNPLGYRIGITEPWRSRWYATRKDFGKLLLEDQRIRNFIKKEFRSAAIPRIDIERTREAVTIIVYTGRPGVLIGRKGAKVDQLRADLERLTGNKVDIRTREVEKPELSAQLVAESVAEQLEKRASFRRAVKKTAQLSMQMGARGVKIHISGRLGGGEMARQEKVSFGSVPLSTLRAEVDYGFAIARTTYGVIGCKAWVYRGLYPLKERKQKSSPSSAEVTHGVDA
jgi:small subunit ribosomal protein S3